MGFNGLPELIEENLNAVSAIVPVPEKSRSELVSRSETLTSETGPEFRYSAAPVLIALISWVAIAWLGSFQYRPVDVVPETAAPDTFSAARAEGFLERLFPDVTPHPAGNNEAFRNRVVAEFEGLGYQIEIQRTFCDVPNWRYDGPRPLPLANLIIRHPGSAKEQAQDKGKEKEKEKEKPLIVLAGHFDSHPVSPGVSDDGISVVICLEIARMLRDQPIGNLVMVLTDGEEYGMLGALELVRMNPDWESPVVINIEARGTAGPSLMFETSDDSYWLSGLFARCSPRPFSSSMFYEVYRFLPNNTDFTVYRNAGWRGLNFAWIGNVANYHTPDDNLQNLDRRSLQHQGENVWNCLRSFADTDLARTPTEAGVWFDVMGLTVVRWPAAWSLYAAIAASVLSGLVLIRAEGVVKLPKRAGAWAIVGLIAVFLTCCGTVWLVYQGLQLDGVLDSLYPRHPVPVALVFWLWPLTVVSAAAWLISPQTGPGLMVAAVGALWCALAMVTSIFVCGVSFLFLVPTAVLSLSGLVFTGFRRYLHPDRFAVWIAVPASLSTGLLWLPMERLFYDVAGFGMMIAITVRIPLSLTTMLPLFFAVPRRLQMRLTIAIALSATLATVLAVTMNPE
jgi:Peptidase family M28